MARAEAAANVRSGCEVLVIENYLTHNTVGASFMVFMQGMNRTKQLWRTVKYYRGLFKVLRQWKNSAVRRKCFQCRPFCVQNLFETTCSFQARISYDDLP